MEIGHYESKLTTRTPISDGKKKEPRKRKLSIRHQLVAEYAARGYPSDVIAKEVNLTTKRVRQILRNEEVMREADRITAEIFSEADRLVVLLYKKALSKLDIHLDSENLDITDKAIDKIFKCLGYNRGKGSEGGIVGRLIAGDERNPTTLDIDALIIQKRRERGLEP